MKLKLGLFAFNSMGGLSLLKKNLWNANWHEIENLIKKAEQNSFNFILPLSKFTGWKGEKNPHGFAYETFVMTAGLLNITKKIILYQQFTYLLLIQYTQQKLVNLWQQ